MKVSALLLTLVAVLCGCGGATTGSSAAPGVISTACVAQPALVYPTNGAVNIPDGDFSITLSNQYGSSLILTTGAMLAGAAVTGGVTSQISVPLAGVSQYAVPQLQPSTKYWINVSVPAYDLPCMTGGGALVGGGAPAGAIVTFGSFTTK